MVTGYSLADLSKGLQAMRSKGIHPTLLHQGVNCFASSEQLRVDEARKSHLVAGTSLVTVKNGEKHRDQIEQENMYLNVNN